MFFGRGGARSRTDDSTSDRVVSGAGGGAVSADEHERAGHDALAGTYWTSGGECKALGRGGGGTASLWRAGRTDRRTPGGLDGVRVGVWSAAGVLASTLCRGARWQL